MLMAQPWKCVQCGVTGSIHYVTGVGVWAVIQKFDDAHKEASPTCPAGYRQLQIDGYPYEVNEDG